jgi:hypothetical protein
VELLQAVGLSAPAGLNAYLTLLMVGLAGRFGWVELTGTLGERLTNPYILGALVLLTAYEFAVDKVPGLDHVNDVIGTVVRPLSGAVVMLATPNQLSDQSPVLAVTVGAGLAGALHTLKALLRPVLTVGTGGLGNPVMSLLEDIAAAGTVVIAIVAPFLIALMLLALVAIFWWAYSRWRARRRRISDMVPES